MLRLIPILLVLVACETAEREPAPATTPDSAQPAQPAAVTDSAHGPEGPSGAWDEARARGVEFRGLGQEPGWLLEIDRRQIHFAPDYGQTHIYTPVPEPSRDSLGRETYHAVTEAHDLRVTIADSVCFDGMSGFRSPFTVTVMLDQRMYRGCGRDLTSR